MVVHFFFTRPLGQADTVKTNPEWSKALKHIQFAKNSRKHSIIKATPFEVLFGHKAQLGVDCLGLDNEMLEG